MKEQFSSVLAQLCSYARQTVRVGGGAVTHTRYAADLLLYLIEGTDPPVSNPWHRELKTLLT